MEGVTAEGGAEGEAGDRTTPTPLPEVDESLEAAADVIYGSSDDLRSSSVPRGGLVMVGLALVSGDDGTATEAGVGVAGAARATDRERKETPTRRRRTRVKRE